MGTNAISAIPMLVEALDHPEPSIYYAAERALQRLGLEPDVTIPALIRVLEHSSQSGRSDVKYRLAYFGTNAAQVVPYLQLALTNQDHRVRTEITNVLEMIEKEPSKRASGE